MYAHTAASPCPPEAASKSARIWLASGDSACSSGASSVTSSTAYVCAHVEMRVSFATNPVTKGPVSDQEPKPAGAKTGDIA